MEVPQVTWEDIGGLEDVKRELQELVQVSFTTDVLLSQLKNTIIKSRISYFLVWAANRVNAEALWHLF